MQSLTIDTGEIKLLINNDPERVISFNPSDVSFAERFIVLYSDFKRRLTEYQVRSDQLEKDKLADDNGLPLNMAERVKLMREACEYTRDKLDDLFGAGTSKTAFGDTLTLDLFGQFFLKITPFVQKARTEKLKLYMAETNQANLANLARKPRARKGSK